MTFAQNVPSCLQGAAQRPSETEAGANLVEVIEDVEAQVRRSTQNRIGSLQRLPTIELRISRRSRRRCYR